MNGQVTITYTVPASGLAGQLVMDAHLLAPGTALADKAAALSRDPGSRPRLPVRAIRGSATDRVVEVQLSCFEIKPL